MTQPASTDDIPPAPSGATLTTLENGLTIIVREDHSAPVVSAQAWCMAGSVHEGKWLGAGLSHILEHMLFKGTTTRPGSRIDQEVQEAGGYMNAYTSFDRTVYHIDVPDTGAVVAVDILCDIMQHATLPAEELAKEQDVIRREMDMNVDDPGRRSSRRLFETAYTRSPYRFTVIGYPDIFNELKPQDISDYYREKYAPNNVFYVVVGDIRAGTVIDQIRAAYAGAKRGRCPGCRWPRNPGKPRRGNRRRGAHRTRPSALLVAYSGSAASGCPPPGCAGRGARTGPQLAALPGAARETGRRAPRRRLDLQPGRPRACSA